MNYGAIPAIGAAAYYLLALAGSLRHLFKRKSDSSFSPGVSILKPIRGRDPGFYEAIRSHALQDYPEFEILFGVRDPDDPAIVDIERLIAEFPGRPIRLLHVTRQEPNGKVGVIAELAREARYPIILVNDSDIEVEQSYLRSVVAPLADPSIGAVTCLYRARAGSWPSRWEAIGIETEFAPSVLTARLLGMNGFTLGSTMVFRAEEIRQIGGFDAVREYIADDYQLGKRIAELGYRVDLSASVVETNLGSASWKKVWRHQLRWARTIRVSNPAGYYGYVVTHATLWSVVAITLGAWRIGVAALLVRMAAGLLCGACILGDRRILHDFYLIPLRDLWGFTNWFCGLFGDTVEWRGRKLRLSKSGKIMLADSEAR